MSKSKTRVKVIALILGGLAILFFVAFIIGEGIPDLRDSENSQLKSMLTLLAFSAFGYFFSFWKPKEGGIVMTITGALLGMNMFYHGGTDEIVPALIFALPFLVPGILLWWVGSNKQVNDPE